MPGVVGQLLDNTKVASGESRCPWGHHPFHGLPCDGGDAFEVLVVVHDGYAVMLGDRRNDQVRDLDRAVKSLVGQCFLDLPCTNPHGVGGVDVFERVTPLGAQCSMVLAGTRRDSELEIGNAAPGQ